MITWIMVIAAILAVICLPSIMAALFRLAAPKGQAFWVSLGVGLWWAIFTEAIGSPRSGIVDLINSTQHYIESPRLQGVHIILIVVLKIGLFSALATLGVDLADKMKTRKSAK